MSKAEKIEGRVLGMFPVEWALTIGMLALLGTMVGLAAKRDHVTETFNSGYVERANIYTANAGVVDAERIFGLLGPEMKRCHTYSYFALRFQLESDGPELDDKAVRARGSQSFDACMSNVLDHVSGVVENDIIEKLRASLDCKTGCAVPVIPGAKPWKAGW